MNPELLTLAAIVAIAIIKLTAFFLSYGIVRLGYDTLIRGLKGEFEFSASAGGQKKATLKGASPGLLFVLLGALLIGWAMAANRTINYQANPSGQSSLKNATAAPRAADQK